MRNTPSTQTLEMPPLAVRADVGTVNEEARTVELVFSTGAGVERFDWLSGKRYLEKLSLKPEHVRLDRLNAGAPLLDAHSAYSVTDQIGAVEPGTAKIVAGQGRATVRFSRRETVEPIWQDVRDGILRNVSVGYRVHTFEEKTDQKAALPVRTAIDWEPFEISMVPMGADAGARVRSHGVETNPCVLIQRAETKETIMGEDTSATLVEQNPLDTDQRTAAHVTPTDRDLGVVAERNRIEGVLLACRAARLPQSFADQMIRDGVALVDAQTKVFEELAKRDLAGVPRGGGGDVRLIGDDPLVHVRAGIENALLHRVAPAFFKLEDSGRNYRGLTLLDTARLFLSARGVRITGMSKMDLAGLALGLNVRAGMHTASDFALLLADVANKTLRAAYNEAAQTFTAIGRRVTLPDFKPVRRLQLGEAPQLLEVNENGEFTRGTIGEGSEVFQLATYGRVFAISRKALVNDDTDAFARIAMLFGRAARNLESTLVWQQIVNNPHMGDGQDLFHADHSNLADPGDVISVAAIGTGRAAMRNQTGLDGATLLNVVPKFLVVPPSLETIADQFVSTNLMANQATVVNPFAGRLVVITEPRLEAGTNGSAIAWYLAASPDQIDMVEYGSLEGEEGPVVESRIGFDVDGVEIKARHDFAAKVIDHRGLYKNVGSES